jgi:FkbM family methyltransferase
MEKARQTFRHPISRIAQWRRKLADRLGRGLGHMPRVVNAQGARFLVDTTDFIDQCIAWEGMWDGPQLDRLAAVSLAAQPAGYFVDVGANSGFYSVMFATRNLANRIVAFEPDPGNYARLLSNLTLNGLCHRVDARRLALGDAEGDVTLYEGAMWNKGESSIALPDQTPKGVTHLVQQARFDSLFALSDERIIIKMESKATNSRHLPAWSRRCDEIPVTFRLSYTQSGSMNYSIYSRDWVTGLYIPNLSIIFSPICPRSARPVLGLARASLTPRQRVVLA